MLSRVANSLYWLSRYVERAENVARFIHVNLHLMLDMPRDEHPASQWRPLVWISGDQELFTKNYGEATEANVLRFLTFDPENPNSILSCLRSARENARTIREIISSDMWETINRAYLMVNNSALSTAGESAHDFYTSIKTSSHLFSGVTHATMSHGEGWHFGRMGQLLERADKTSRILDAKYFILLPSVEHVGMPLDALQWAALLKSASAFEMFQQRFSTITPRSVSQFLIFDRQFPRAILHCLAKIQESMHAITGSEQRTFTNAAEQHLGRLAAEVNYAQMDQILKQGLHEYLDHLQSEFNAIDAAIASTFFAENIEQSQPMWQTQRQ